VTRWAAFAGVTLAVLFLLLVLARLSQSVVTGAYVTREERRWLDRLPDGADHLDSRSAPAPRTSPAESTLEPDPEPSTLALLANVSVSQGFFALLLLGGAWLAEVPASALGVAADSLSTGLPALAVGVAAGVGLSLANALAGGLAERFNGDPSEELRELLSPESLGGWVVLLGVVLPIIAGFEELLFRAALVGAFSVGFGVSPWALVAFSSVAFAVGHGAQGTLGVVVTGLLGAALGALFVLTNSLLAVVVAHYLVNAVEFVVGEGLEWRPFR
jgi:membrane protease YdiL (CAAX protease family)